MSFETTPDYVEDFRRLVHNETPFPEEEKRNVIRSVNIVLNLSHYQSLVEAEADYATRVSHRVQLDKLRDKNMRMSIDCIVSNGENAGEQTRKAYTENLEAFHNEVILRVLEAQVASMRRRPVAYAHEDVDKGKGKDKDKGLVTSALDLLKRLIEKTPA